MNSLLAGLEAGDTLITATTRQARHWRWRFDTRQQARGLRSWPAPQICTLVHWLEQAWEASLVAGGAAGARGLLSPLQAQLLWRQVMAGDAQHHEISTSAGTVGLVQRAWSTAIDWDISLRSLKAAATTADAMAFARWSADFDGALRDGGWVDSGLLSARIAQDIAAGVIPVPPVVHYCGFAVVTPRIDSIFGALRDASCEVREVLDPLQATPIRARVYRSTEHEFTGLAAHLAERYQRNPQAILGLVLPNEKRVTPALRHDLLDQLAPGWCNGLSGGLPVTMPRGRSLDSAGVVHSALLILRLVQGGLDYQSFGQLLRSPYIGGANSEAQGRAQLDLRLRKDSQRDILLADVLALRDPPAPIFAQQLIAAHRHIAAAKKSRDPMDWVPWIEALLQCFAWPTGRELCTEEQSALQSWQRLLDRFATAGVIAGRISPRAMLGLLRSLATGQDFQALVRADGVQVLSPQEAIGHRCDEIWIAGMSSEAWPPAPLPDPLLPLAVQRQVGVTGADPQAHQRWANELMAKLFASADSVQVSYARYEEQSCLTPSPCLQGFSIEAGSVDQRLPAHSAWRESASLAVVTADRPPPLAADEKVRGGSRLLQLQAACPARAFYELRLGAQELFVPILGINARIRGELVHHAAQILYETLREQNLPPASHQASQQIAPAVAGALRNLRRSRHTLMRVLCDLEQQRITDQLKELLQLEAERPSFKPIATEAALSLELGPLSINLRLDRVDEMEAGDRLVIDYKTGTKLAGNAWLGPRIKEPQLPLYAIASSVTGVALLYINARAVEYRGVAAADLQIPKVVAVEEFARKQFPDWASLCASWRTDLTALAEEFALGICSIHLSDINLATGQFAPLTKVYELAVELEE